MGLLLLPETESGRPILIYEERGHSHTKPLPEEQRTERGEAKTKSVNITESTNGSFRLDALKIDFRAAEFFRYGQTTNQLASDDVRHTGHFRVLSVFG